MGLIVEKDERDGYRYDAAIKGGDTTFWAEVVGTIGTDTTGINRTLRVNADRLHSFLQHIYGNYEFSLNVPVNPDSTTDASWGLRSPKEDTTVTDTGTRGGGVYFEMDTSAVFRSVSYDDFGNRERTTITWDSDWSGRQIRFQIRWEQEDVKFLVNDSVVSTHDSAIPTRPKPLELRNGAASNIDVAYVEVSQAGAII